jgi:hypothetical protein
LALSSGHSRKYLTGTKVPMYAALPPARHRSDNLISFIGRSGRVDSRIATAFQDVQHLAVLINEYFERDERLAGDVFQEVVGSTQMLLLNMDPFKRDLLSESIRLGMLALLSTLVSLPGKRVSYPYLETAFRRVLARHQGRELDNEEDAVILWLLMMGAMSVVSPGEAWLQEQWRRASRNEQDWDSVRTQLRRMIWINNIHDEAGTNVFQTLKMP